MDAAPKIPTLKDSKKPQVKVRGLGVGLNLAERLKQFKKKDLAFILAGLGVLFMAPLAEHFMMAPEGGDGTLKPGWSGPGSGGSGSLGGGGSPYERTDGLAPGGPTGGGADIITPLNVRDPSSLIMGPSAAQQPPTNSALAGTPPGPPSRSDADLKDALAASARGLGAAAKKAPMPLPKVALGGSGLRGLGVAGGGSSASAGLGGISAANVPNKASMADSTGNARPTKGYSGVARGQTQGGSGVEALKAAASKQGEGFNRSGSAASDLNAAAQTAIPSGGAGGAAGGPAGGKDDKGFGGNQDKGSKTVGESLAFLEKKSRMEKDLELEYKKKEKNDWGLIGADLRNDFLKTMVSKGMAEPIAGAAGTLLGDLLKGGAGPSYTCRKYKGTGYVTIPVSKIAKAGDEKGAYIREGDIIYSMIGNAKGAQIGEACVLNQPDDKEDKGKDEGPGSGVQSVGQSVGQVDLSKACGDVNKTLAPAAEGLKESNPTDLTQFTTNIKAQMGTLAAAQSALIGTAPLQSCVAGSPGTSSTSSIAGDIKKSIQTLQQAAIGVHKDADLTARQSSGKYTALDLNAMLKRIGAVRGSITSVKMEVPPTLKNDKGVKTIEDTRTEAQRNLETTTDNLSQCLRGINLDQGQIDQMVGADGTLNRVVNVNKAFEEKVEKFMESAGSSMPQDEDKKNIKVDQGLDKTAQAIQKAKKAIADADTAIKKFSNTKQQANSEEAVKLTKAAAEAVKTMRSAQKDWAAQVEEDLEAQDRFLDSITNTPPLK